MEAVTAVGGSILSACFDGVLDRLKTNDFLKYVDQGQILIQLKKWEKMLRRIYAVLDDAEEKQTADRLVEMWLDDLKHLAYDLEDLLDELETEVHLRKLEHEDYKVRPSKVRRIFSSISTAANPSYIKFNVEMVSRIEEITARLDEIVREKDDLYLGESNRSSRVEKVRERLPSSSLVNEAKVFGREDDKKAILELLKAEACGTNVSVVPIIGLGGVGKTTLCQLVYNEPSLKFDFKAWVCVGEDFDICRITKTILQSGEGNDKDLNSLQGKLKQKLFGRKFLIVLDDVWSENYEQWTMFLCPFEGGAVGSKIIITTRNQEVSRMTGTIPAYHLKELPYDECLTVFAQHALGAPNFNQQLHLEVIGKQIVERCKGLPLAAKALGGLLRGKQNVNAWKEVLHNEIWSLSSSYVLPALRLSYLYLPPQLKRCFAYCAIFPKSFEFEKDELISLWKAESFLCHPKDKKQTVDLGQRYFNDLLSRSFFQQSNDYKSRYVMHDLINDLARFVSRGTCFYLVDNEWEGANSYANIRHSAFIPCTFNNFQRFKCFEEMKKLRTFLSVPQSNFGCYISRKVLHDLVPKLKCLRVLSLTGYWCMELPSSVGELKQLRYLDLSCTTIERLPESLGEFFYLETLKVHDCDELIELPESICNLLNLQYLDISNTYKLKQLPLQIGNLTNLWVLTKFIVGEGINGLRISELKKFSQLEGKLWIEGLENVLDQDLDFVNLKERPRLLELDLVWTFSLGLDFVNRKFRNSDHEWLVLNSLEPHMNLSSLSVVCFGGKEFPSWIGNPIFCYMVELKLVNCWNITALPPLGRLPLLKDLIIEGFPGVEGVGIEFYEDHSSFSSLETLCIRGMERWKEWSWSNSLSEDNVAKFCKLRKLHIESCQKLRGQLPSSFPSLEELEIKDCPELVESPKLLPSLVRLSIGGCQEAVLRNLCSAPCLTQLRIERISGLVRLDESYMQTLAALEDLKIRECAELEHLWADGTNLDYVTCLRHLSIMDCSKLVSLVDGEEGLFPCNLESLKIDLCHELKELPNGLHSLKSLKDLSVSFCENLVSLPAGGVLYSLKQLEVLFCPSFEVLYSGEMSNLETLILEDCHFVSCFPNAKFPNSLKTLSIHKGTKQLMESLYYGFSQLTDLVINDLEKLELFPERELHIPTLISLTISKCKRLKSLSYHMQSFHHLQNLKILYCDELMELQAKGLPNSNLISLEIERCKNLRYLPDRLPSKLFELEIRYCRNLSNPMSNWGLHRLTRLRKLRVGYIGSTSDIVSFPDDGGLLLPASLTDLIIHGFENLESISRGIQNLTALQSFFIDDCPKIKSLPDDGLPFTLGCLVIVLCPLLTRRCLKDRGAYWPLISHIPFLQLKMRC